MDASFINATSPASATIPLLSRSPFNHKARDAVTVPPAVMVTELELDQNLSFDAVRVYAPGEILVRI